MSLRTYVDTGVLIAAFRGDSECHESARQVLDDPNRELVGSQYLELEVVPKPTFHKRDLETKFMRTALDSFASIVESAPEISRAAIQLACKHDVTGIDALHVAAALHAAVDELVTTESTAKPMFRVADLVCRSLLLASRATKD